MDEEEESGGGGWGGFARLSGIGLVSLVAVYVLSVGPMERLYDEGMVPGQLMGVYEPLLQVMVRSVRFERIMRWYVCNFWKSKVIWDIH
jgi:hypothetical protein